MHFRSLALMVGCIQVMLQLLMKEVMVKLLGEWRTWSSEAVRIFTLEKLRNFFTRILRLWKLRCNFLTIFLNNTWNCQGIWGFWWTIGRRTLCLDKTESRMFLGWERGENLLQGKNRAFQNSQIYLICDRVSKHRNRTRDRIGIF